MTQLEQVQRLLDSLVAAGAPGAAAWVQDERGSLRPPVAWPTWTAADRWGRSCTSAPAA